MRNFINVEAEPKEIGTPSVNPYKKRKGNIFIVTMVVMLVLLATGINLMWAAEFSMRHSRTAITSSRIYYSMESAVQTISQLFYIRLNDGDFVFQGQPYRANWVEPVWAIPTFEYDDTLGYYIQVDRWDENSMFISEIFNNFPADYIHFRLDDGIAIVESPMLPDDTAFMDNLDRRIVEITADIHKIIAENAEFFGGVELVSIELKDRDNPTILEFTSSDYVSGNVIVYPIKYYNDPVFLITVKHGVREMRAEFEVTTERSKVVETISSAPYSAQLIDVLNAIENAEPISDADWFDWFMNPNRKRETLFGVWAELFVASVPYPTTDDFNDFSDYQQSIAEDVWDVAKTTLRGKYGGIQLIVGATSTNTVRIATQIDPRSGKVHLHVQEDLTTGERGNLALSATQTAALLRYAESIVVEGDFIIPPGHYEAPNLKKVIVHGDIIIGVNPDITMGIGLADIDEFSAPSVWRGALTHGSVGQRVSINAGKDYSPIEWISRFGNIVIGCAEGMDTAGVNYSHIHALDGSIFVAQHGNIIFETTGNGGLLGTNSIFMAMTCEDTDCNYCYITEAGTYERVREGRGAGNIIMPTKRRNMRIAHSGVVPQFYADNKIVMYGDSNFSKFWGLFVAPSIEYDGFMGSGQVVGSLVGDLEDTGSYVVNLNEVMTPIFLSGGIFDFLDVQDLMIIPEASLVNYRVKTSPDIIIYGK